MSIFGPSLVARGLDLLAGDAERRIIGNAALLHRPFEHRAQRVEEIALRERRRGLLVDDALHMLARQQHGAPTARCRCGTAACRHAPRGSFRGCFAACAASRRRRF